MLQLAEAAAAAGNPSAITTALIAAGSAILGVIAGGLIQMFVEGRRATHQQDLEDQRAANQRKLDEAQAKREREAVERDVAARSKSAARILRDDLGRALMRFEIAANSREWWPVEPLRLRVATDDRRILASQLDLESWERVSYTEGLVDALLARRSVRVDAGQRLLHDDDVSSLRHALSAIERARTELARLAQ